MALVDNMNSKGKMLVKKVLSAKTSHVSEQTYK